MTTETRKEPEQSEAGSIPKLVFRSGGLRGRVLVIDKDRVSIGRDAGNDIVIKDDIVSSYHAVLGHDAEGSYWIQDAGSKNGTFLNGRRIDRAPLEEGDVFCLCQAGPEIQFTLGSPTLPSLFTTSTSTFARTKSLGNAIRELLPQAASKLALSSTGISRLFDNKLEEVSRRARRTVLIASVAVASVILMGLAALGFHLAGRPGGEETKVTAAVRLELELEPIYSSLFLSYRDQPIGKAQVTNLGTASLSGARLQFAFEKEAEPFLVESLLIDLPELAPGDSWSTPIAPKLSSSILSERTREVTAALRLVIGGEVVHSEGRAVFVYGHTVFNWENPERIAAFIDPEEPAVLAFLKAVWTQSDLPRASRHEFPPENIVRAAVLLTALAERSIQYLPDARTPISASSQWKANDRVSYPGETLLERTGDCDDLAVLCAALLEAARIPTAFLVGADHVLFMFDSGLEARSLAETPFDPESVVPWSGRLWLPIESTNLARPGATFATAWADAWRQRDAIAGGEMAIVDVRQAWQRYKPLNPPPPAALLKRIEETAWVRPGLGERAAEVLQSLKALFLKNLERRAEELAAGLEGLAREQMIGLLYARSGLYGEARAVFERALFGAAVPRGAGAIAGWSGEVTPEFSIVLNDLAIAASLGAHSQAELDEAAGYYELALRDLPDESPEKAEMLLRLGLILRMRGKLVEGNSIIDRAFLLAPGLDATYKALRAGDGSVAGESPEIWRYLKRGLR
jgi:tetratricopeptide (TPR) repeat protein